MLRQSQTVIGVLELVVPPAKSGSGVALGQSEDGVVTCVVETTVYAVAGMAVATPGHTGFLGYLGTAHIGIIEIHGVLQELCVVVSITGGCGHSGH